MKNMISFVGKTPKIGDDVHIDPSARIIGDVILRIGCSVWPLSVLRAFFHGNVASLMFVALLLTSRAVKHLLVRSVFTRAKVF